MRLREQVVLACGALLAACSAPVPVAGPHAAVPQGSYPAVTQAAPQAAVPQTLDAYKKEFARHVAHSSPAVFRDPLPKIFKSIVVLDVTIDPNGRLAHVKVHRSNGYKELENVALLSVRHAAPFGVPSRALRGRDGSVNFLETFLFRDDGRFQIRSLVEDS